MMTTRSRQHSAARLISGALLVVASGGLLLQGGFAAAADDDRDRIEFTDGHKADAIVSSELSDETHYKTVAAGADIHPKTRTIKRIIYSGMVSDGPWRKAMEAKDRGRFEEAAEDFGQLADSGTREWEKVYGAMQEGDAWEQAGKFDEAVKAFHLVADTAKFDQDDKAQPRHRLWLDSCYRLGVALAENKDADGANKLADNLESYSNLRNVNSSGAQSRANAIRAAVAAVAGDQNKFSDASEKVILRPDDGDTWVHFNLLSADTWRKFGKPKQAAQILDDLLAGLANDPPRRAQAMLLKGQTLLDSDPQAALIELIRIDVLPFGSEDQKCLARYDAGILLRDQADKMKANPATAKDDRKAAFVDELYATARLLLSAVTGSTSEIPEKAKAQAVLDSLPKDPDAAPDANAAPATGAAAATAAAPDGH